MRHCELEHEIPSASELHEYVLCKLENCPLVGLVPELPVSADSEGWFEESEVRAFAELGGTSFGRSAVDTLLRAHERLNKLPRSDPFWEGGNRRPTQLKVVAFCNRLLSQNPFDVDALRTLAVMQSVRSANDFGQCYWARLIRLGAEDSTIPTFAALLTGLVSHSSAAQWAAFVTEVKHAESARPLVEGFAELRHERIAGWAKRALRALRFFSRTR